MRSFNAQDSRQESANINHLKAQFIKLQMQADLIGKAIVYV